MKNIMIAAFCVAVLAAPAWADPSSAELAAVKQAEARGAEMYAYDQAAWHSTDAFQADLEKRGWTIESIQARGFAGYIVEPAENGRLLATYYGKKDGKLFAMARYWVLGSRVERGGLVKEGDDAALSPLAQKLTETRGKAFEAAIAQKIGLCGKGNPNTIVLPPGADGSIPAYIMSSSTETGHFPAGGHYRFVFGADGKLLSSRAFTKSCIDVISGNNGSKEVVGFGLTHMLDPQPTEVHAFVSYNVPIKLNVIVTSNGTVWEVDRGKITFQQVIKDQP